MTAKIINLPRSKVFTSNEQLVEALRDAIFANGRPYRDIALQVGVGKNTIGRIANGTTRWPKPTTLFPLMSALGYQLKMEKTR